MQDYKSLYAAVMICAILVNVWTETHMNTRMHARTRTQKQHLISLYDELSLLS